MADGAEKNLQEKFRSHQLVLMLTGDFLFNKDLQINFSIWYLIWWAASPTPPAGSISAAGWLERSHGKRTCSHSAQPRPPSTGLNSDGQWGKSKMVKNSSALVHGMCRGTNGSGSMSSGPQTAQTSPSEWRHHFVWLSTAPVHGHSRYTA